MDVKRGGNASKLWQMWNDVKQRKKQRKWKRKRERENHVNGTIDFYSFPFAFRRRQGVEDRRLHKAEGWEQLKGVRDSLNPLNARNNLRSVPSATIFSGEGEGFLSPGLLLPFFPFSLFFHLPQKPTPVIHDFLGAPPTAMPPELASSIHKPANVVEETVDRSTYIRSVCSSYYTILYLLSGRKCHLAWLI